MPGIAGLISDQNEESLFSSVLASMNHRNYVFDRFLDQGLHLAGIHHPFQSANGQPLYSEDGRYVLLFYGEVFSIDRVAVAAAADGPVLFLRFIERHGLDNLSLINGQFLCCLHDHQARATYLITDRFGTHPLYYALHRGRLIFASEVKALLCDDIPRQINHQSIAELFSFGHLFGYKTLFESIQQVPPASCLKFQDGRLTLNTYWAYPYDEQTYITAKTDARKVADLTDELGQIMITAAKRQSFGSEDMLIPLSGGLDSRFVVALYHRIGCRNMETFTMGPPESEDRRYGGTVARLLDFPNVGYEISPERTWEDAERFAHLSDHMSYICGPLQMFQPYEDFAHTKEILSASQMADALFGSTLIRKNVKRIEQKGLSRSAKDGLLIDMFNIMDQQTVKPLFHDHVFRKLDGLYRTEPATYCDHHVHPLHAYYKMLMNEHGRRGTLCGNLVSNLFFGTRMISYDNDLFDFAWRLPIELRRYQYLYRKTFTDLFPELARVKRQGMGLGIDISNFRFRAKILENKLATVVLNSPLRSLAKMYKPWFRPSYTDYNNWFRGPLRLKLSAFLSDPKLLAGELLDLRQVRKLLDDHLSGKGNHAIILWQIINLEYFYRNFIRK